MIILFRHGKTLWNLEKRLQGQENNSELLPIDSELIENINTEFKSLIFDNLFVSPAKRACDYIKFFDLKFKLKIIEPSLNEISFGVLSGCRMDEIEPQILRARNENKWYFRPQNGESYDDLFHRLDNFSKYLLSISEQYIAIVGHETCNKVLIGKLLNFSREKILKLKQANECVYKIQDNNLYKKDFIGESKWEKL